MSKRQALAQLHDIHLPQPLGWWPLAPGWYLLALLIIAFLAFALVILLRRHANHKAKREALRLLITYQQQYKANNAQLTCARLSELLKRVALAYFPREKVASLQGKDWIEFLNRTARGVDFTKMKCELLELPFRQGMANRDLSSFFDMTKAWIEQRKKPCSN